MTIVAQVAETGVLRKRANRHACNSPLQRLEDLENLPEMTAYETVAHSSGIHRRDDAIIQIALALQLQ